VAMPIYCAFVLLLIPLIALVGIITEANLLDAGPAGSGMFSARLNGLFAVSHYDTIVVLCVLEVVLGKDPIAGRQRVAGVGDVFFSYVRRSATDFYTVRTIRLEASRKRVLTLASVATTAPAVLLPLPHRHLFSAS
jgi:hypothetical protein